MFYNPRKSEETDRERYLADELERERDQRREDEERQWQKREKERKDHQEEMQERYEYEMRSADDWPEALQKQASLCRREHNQFPEDSDGENMFLHLAEANEKALEIWQEVAESKQAELNELQKQIEAVWDRVRNEVADKLIAADDNIEFKRTAETIRNNQLDGYLDW